MTDLAQVAQSLVAQGKGLLAADERPDTLTKRFTAVRIASTPDMRRDYREMLVTTPGVSEFLSGVILHDETIRQKTASGELIVVAIEKLGMLPGIKVDLGAKPMASSPGELVTEGLDGLRERLVEYRRMGARFAKWRAVLSIGDARPSRLCIESNAEALARYAALCQEQDLVPIVEPEILMDGAHTIERTEEVTSEVQELVFEALYAHHVRLEAMLLKPNMVVPGEDATPPAAPHIVASATLRCLRRHVPPAVPGIVFLSGGQHDVVAIRCLGAINRAHGPRPWRLSFSFGRALQDAALARWGGKPENVEAAQQVFYEKARACSLAALGAYTDQLEAAPPQRVEAMLRDD
ncbi:MAG: fructose-bisphosphate aldolase class I [Kofleriaceae bacterium]|nr:fructose-bisphosphate aldolase class I [Kofleriaceae bacterium]